MDFDDVRELHYITPLENVRSIFVSGLLSYERAQDAEHLSVADDDVQERRRLVKVPTPGGARHLHTYANLYFDARNPMMYKRRGSHAELAVLRVDREVLLLADVIVTDSNASSDHVRFGNGVDGLAIVDKELVFAQSWMSADLFEYYRRKSARCAEVLVPGVVPPEMLLGAYLSGDSAIARAQHLGLPDQCVVTRNAHIFFQ